DLVDLDLRQGKLVSADPMTEFHQGLPRGPAAIETLEVMGETVGPWVRASTSAFSTFDTLGGLSSFQYPEMTPCLDFDSTVVTESHRDDIYSAAALTASSAIAVGGVNHLLFQVDHHKAILLPQIPNFLPQAAFRG